MYKPTSFVPDNTFTVFTYLSHWDGGMFFHQIHQTHVFNFYYLAPTPNQAEQAQHFGPPREFWEIFYSQ